MIGTGRAGPAWSVHGQAEPGDTWPPDPDRGDVRLPAAPCRCPGASREWRGLRRSAGAGGASRQRATPGPGSRIRGARMDGRLRRRKESTPVPLRFGRPVPPHRSGGGVLGSAVRVCRRYPTRPGSSVVRAQLIHNTSGQPTTGHTRGVARVLASMIQGKGLYFDSVGEFFQLYGRFEQLLGLADNCKQAQMGDEMRTRLGGEAARHSRDYVRDGITSSTPLPLYVRNVLTHQGTNPANSLRDGDVSTAIRLLKDWLG